MMVMIKTMMMMMMISKASMHVCGLYCSHTVVVFVYVHSSTLFESMPFEVYTCNSIHCYNAARRTVIRIPEELKERSEELTYEGNYSPLNFNGLRHYHER
jgi:hypothetical protein